MQYLPMPEEARQNKPRICNSTVTTLSATYAKQKPSADLHVQHQPLSCQQPPARYKSPPAAADDTTGEKGWVHRIGVAEGVQEKAGTRRGGGGCVCTTARARLGSRPHLLGGS